MIPEATLRRALAISEEAAAIAAAAFKAPPPAEIKADDSPVTRADRDTETAIRDALARAFHGDGIFGEEYGSDGLERSRVWIVDPIDGTKSFLAGVPLFGLLMGLLVEGRPELGIIRLPALGRSYSARRGGGAQCDGAPIKVSQCQRLDEAVLFINEGEKIFDDSAALFARLCGAGRMRRLGYDCHPHALLAEGRIDAVVDYDLKPYDYLPVAPVVEAAGGVMTDWQGRPLGLGSDGRVVSAATPRLHGELLELLNR